MNKSLVFWLAVLMMFGGVMVIYAAWRVTQRSQVPVAEVGQTLVHVVPDKPATEKSDEVKLTRFEFTERSGKPFQSEQLDGKVYVASFFFALCPATCRTQNEKMQTLQRLYEGKDVRFLSITCDPESDTPEALQKYAKMFNADPESWLFLTGDMEYTEQVGHNFFGVPVAKQGHTEKFIVVDRSGTIRGYFHWAKPAEFAKLQALIDELLEEPVKQESPVNESASDAVTELDSAEEDKAVDGATDGDATSEDEDVSVGQPADVSSS